MTSCRSFPALGFDPAEGDREAVRAAALSILTAKQSIDYTLPRLQEATEIAGDADWGGSAAEEFRDHGDDLPQGLGKGAESMAAASDALDSWLTQLTANQAKADELEAKAKKLKEQLRRAEAEVRDAQHAMLAEPNCASQGYQRAQREYFAATATVERLDRELRAVIDDAKRLRAKHEREADEAAEKIRSGPDDAFEPESDGWVVQTLDGVSKVSGVVSAATGAAAAGLAVTGVGLPVAGVLGTVSAGTAGINTLSNIGQIVADSRHAPSLPALALDALPTGRIYRSAKEVRDVTRLIRERGVKQALKTRAASDAINRVAEGTRKQAGKALAGAIGTTGAALDAAGVELSDSQKREFEALTLLADPSKDQLLSSAISEAKRQLGE